MLVTNSKSTCLALYTPCSGLLCFNHTTNFGSVFQVFYFASQMDRFHRCCGRGFDSHVKQNHHMLHVHTKNYSMSEDCQFLVLTAACSNKFLPRWFRTNNFLRYVQPNGINITCLTCLRQELHKSPNLNYWRICQNPLPIATVTLPLLAHCKTHQNKPWLKLKFICTCWPRKRCTFPWRASNICRFLLRASNTYM